MKRIKLFFWWVMIAGALAGVFLLSFVPAELKVYEAREKYEAARLMLNDATELRAKYEQRVEDLATRVESVELGARAEYRLIRPGERLEIIEVRPAQDRFFSDSGR